LGAMASSTSLMVGGCLTLGSEGALTKALMNRGADRPGWWEGEGRGGVRARATRTALGVGGDEACARAPARSGSVYDLTCDRPVGRPHEDRLAVRPLAQRGEHGCLARRATRGFCLGGEAKKERAPLPPFAPGVNRGGWCGGARATQRGGVCAGLC
jgi:hypothetical protein